MSEQLTVEGTCKWFDSARGFGFVYLPDGSEAFTHYSQIKMDGWKTLSEGQRVRFSVEETEKGLQAVEVVPL